MVIVAPLFFQSYDDRHRGKYIYISILVPFFFFFFFRGILCLNESLSAEIIEEFIAVYLGHHDFYQVNAEGYQSMAT